MLSKCANPSCSNEFHYFGEGKVFEIRWDSSSGVARGGHARQHHSVEHYWLCASCSGKLTLALDAARNVLIIPRPTPELDRAAA